MPLLLLMQYGVMRWLGVPLPSLGVPDMTALVSLFVVIFILGIGEELGWMGYAAEPMQERWGALIAAIMIGVVWGVWHTVPFLQNNVTPTWIFWQYANTIGLRVLIFWVYNNAGKSVFVAILFHTMSNIAELVWPFSGDSYDPFFNTIFVTVAVVIVTILWGPKTLAHFRLGRER
ncbi:MAG: CPBP family intramembrane metalloprotease [Anaerolineae bacterium]|nr:CPBP family intramembrane metalloprotease [Anaerolineae bacterium]